MLTVLSRRSATEPVGLPSGGASRRHPFAHFVARRLVAGIATLMIVSVLVFAGTEILPGDAARAVLGRFATPDKIEIVRQELQLDRPAVERYFNWLGDLVRGDPGDSLVQDISVTALIGDRIVNSIVLALVAMLILVPLAMALGIAAGTRPDRPFDHVVSGLSLSVIAVPEFVVGTLLIVGFAVSVAWLPPVSLVTPGRNPLADPEILVLPALTLIVTGFAYTVRIIRAGMAEVMSSEYVQMARLNGFPERRVILRYALPNALAPTVQVIALTFQWLVGGVVIVETLFGYAGIGQALVAGVATRDIPLVQALAMLIAAIYVVINVVADLVVVLLIPKLRTAL